MGIRGFVWAIYIDDDGNRWLMRVDADYFIDPDRGWTAAEPEDVLLWPQGWRPREVEGLEESGVSQRARVGSVDAPLWTRSATTFTVNASDQTAVVATVFRYWHERRRPVPPALP